MTTVARASQIELTADIADIDDAFPEDLRINFFRIVQEGLNNIVKHSNASQGTVTAQRTKSSVVLTISDNGRGLPSEPRNMKAGAGGFGLTGIRERATAAERNSTDQKRDGEWYPACDPLPTGK